MRACAEALSLLSLSLDEELGPLERHKLERHLAECPDCRRRSAGVEAVTRMLRELSPEAPSTLTLPRLPRRRRLARSGFPAAAAIVASLGLVALQGSVDVNRSSTSSTVEVSNATWQSPVTHSSQPQPPPQYAAAAIAWIP
jgi:predicted anti-sigma-YlaC factor YlaD